MKRWLKNIVSSLFAVLILPVPFSSQAPLAEWKDSRQQDGCEEVSALMVVSWIKDKKTLSKEEARKEIINISDFEQKKYGEYRDISLKDVRNWILLDYFQLEPEQVRIVGKVTIKSLKKEIKDGHIILAPTDGRALKNPYFTAPGPERHMVVIKGYDEAKKEFITNDPGTKRGNGYRYKEEILFKAIRAYPTGYHLPIKESRKEVIVIEK